MFGRLFGRRKKDQEAAARDAAAEEAFGEAKQQSLERTLGPMDEMVYHSIIPFVLGGGLDLYTFSACIPGKAFVTQELVSRDKQGRPKPGRQGHFELVACLPPGKGDDEDGLQLVNSLLNPIARYASMASLNPGETAEVPGDDGEPTLPVVFDRFDPKGVGFEVEGEELHLLLCIAVHHSELAHARAKGSADLMKRLQVAGVYPYSWLKRQPVV
jgi:hypothetical protein